MTLNLEVWPWFNFMNYPLIIDNDCVKYYSDSIGQWGVMVHTRIFAMCALWPWLGIMTLGQGHDIPFDHGQPFCEMSRSDKGVRICAPGKMRIDGQADRQIDRHTGWFQYNPLHFVCRLRGITIEYIHHDEFYTYFWDSPRLPTYTEESSKTEMKNDNIVVVCCLIRW